MDKLTKDNICSFVKISISDKKYNDELLFCLSAKVIKRIKDILYIDLTNYQGVISSHSIRHIKKGHPDDISYICDIFEILEKFTHIKKSITRDRRTGSSLVSLEFYKTYNKKTVKLVKLRVYRKKRLELKTLFVKD